MYLSLLSSIRLMYPVDCSRGKVLVSTSLKKQGAANSVVLHAHGYCKSLLGVAMRESEGKIKYGC